MKRIEDASWDCGHWKVTVRYEAESEWERNHLELLTSPLGPVGCADCADEIYDILRACAREHGEEWQEAEGDLRGSEAE